VNTGAVTKRLHRGRVLATLIVASGAVLIVAALVTSGLGMEIPRDGAFGAQDGSLAAGAAQGQVHYHPGRPAHIHKGNCNNLGKVAFPLNPVGAGTMSGAAMADMPAMAIGQAEGLSAATPVEVGSITLDTPLESIVARRYALNIQISEFEYGRYVACGEVGGVIVGDTLAFGLRELNASGFSGLALLEGKGDETLVSVYLTQST